jgi:beta-fructofuranosidase
VLRLTDRWVWDFWHVADGATHHLFFLQAERALGDPDLRHWHASIGHAVSTDLTDWTVVDDTLAPAPAPAWDDFTTWTGSVVRAGDAWHLFYTGTSHRERGLVQRVGHATSSDLTVWQRVDDGRAFELDERWYEQLDLDVWHDQAWRDPVLVHHDGRWHALVTARLLAGSPARRGTIGHATSTDLNTWTVHPPLTGPTPFGHLEIPDVRLVRGRWYLLFSSVLAGSGDDAPTAGTFAVASVGGPLGPWRWDQLHLVLGDGWYGCKLIDTGGPDPDRSLVALAWRERDADGGFGGWISDPLTVTATDDRVHVDLE